MLNTGSSFYPNTVGYLQNTGSGRDSGVELTIEKFFSKGYYGLMTTSLYESKYKGGIGTVMRVLVEVLCLCDCLAGKELN